jgi:hypothetical protein
VKNAEKKELKKRPTADGENGIIKTKADYIKPNWVQELSVRTQTLTLKEKLRLSGMKNKEH